MVISKRYNSIPVKNNCALCLPTPLFLVTGNLMVLFKLPPINPCCHSTIQKLQNFALQPMENLKWYNSVPAKDNCALFSPNPLFSVPGYAMASCKFFPWRPLLSWQPTVFIQRQNWLQAHKSIKCWNTAAGLYSVAMGQIPRSKERISSY